MWWFIIFKLLGWCLNQYNFINLALFVFILTEIVFLADHAFCWGLILKGPTPRRCNRWHCLLVNAIRVGRKRCRMTCSIVLSVTITFRIGICTLCDLDLLRPSQLLFLRGYMIVSRISFANEEFRSVRNVGLEVVRVAHCFVERLWGIHWLVYVFCDDCDFLWAYLEFFDFLLMSHLFILE